MPSEPLQNEALVTSLEPALMALGIGLSHGPSFRRDSAFFKTKLFPQLQVVWGEGSCGEKGKFPSTCASSLSSRTSQQQRGVK